jgi:hypothetical protein
MNPTYEKIREQFTLYNEFSIPPKDGWEKISIKVLRIQKLSRKRLLVPISQKDLSKTNSM